MESRQKPVIIVNSQRSSDPVCQNFSNFRFRVSNTIIPDFILPTKGAAFQIVDGKYISEDTVRTQMQYLSSNHKNAYVILLFDRFDAQSWNSMGMIQSINEELTKPVTILPSTIDKKEEIAEYVEIIDTALGKDDQEMMKDRYSKVLEAEKSPSDEVVGFFSTQ